MTTTAAGPAAAALAVDLPRSKREIYTVMSGLLLAMLLAMLDNLVVGTAMPTIVGELGGLAHLSWVVTAYALATAVSTPVWAKLGDLYGRKSVFMASIVVFLVGSALSGLSQNMVELIGFRGVQGLGAGGLMVGAMAIIADLVPLRERGRYQGLMAAVMPLAFIGGPLLGGFLTDNFSWRWAFYINLPLGVLALVVVALTMHLPGRRAERVAIDWRGAGLLAAGIAALTLLCSWGGSQYPWTSAPIVMLGVVTVGALAAFVAVERRVAEPILALTLFRSRNFTAATVLTFLTGFAMFGAVTFLPQFQQNVQGASATSSGLLLLPLMGGMLATSLLGGQLVTRTGRYRGLLMGGSVAMAAGLGLLATMSVATGQFTTSVYMVVLGVGMGLLMQTTMLVVQNSVAQRDVGVASGAATLFRTIGGSIGVSLLGTLFTQQVQSALPNRTGGAPAGGQVTPGMLEQLPASLREAYQAAITNGVHQVFLWGAVIALVALIAAWAIREVALRGTVTT
jgi:EmrB/QacA subfamily drug resistance transporter